MFSTFCPTLRLLPWTRIVFYLLTKSRNIYRYSSDRGTDYYTHWDNPIPTLYSGFSVLCTDIRDSMYIVSPHRLFANSCYGCLRAQVCPIYRQSTALLQGISWGFTGLMCIQSCPRWLYKATLLFIRSAGGNSCTWNIILNRFPSPFECGTPDLRMAVQLYHLRQTPTRVCRATEVDKRMEKKKTFLWNPLVFFKCAF